MKGSKEAKVKITELADGLETLIIWIEFAVQVMILGATRDVTSAKHTYKRVMSGQ
jgi:hypothetical protein